MAIGVGGSLLSLCNQLLMAYLFGASAEVDAYLLSVSVPTLVGGTLSVLVTYSITPALVQTKLDSEQAHYHFVALTLIAFICAGLVIATVGVFAADRLTIALNPTLSARLHSEAVWMMRIQWVSAVVLFISSYLAAVLNACKRFYVAATALVLPYIGMIICIISLGRSMGISSVPIGMLIGCLAGLLLMWGAVRAEIRINAGCIAAGPQLLEYVGRVPYVLIAMSAFTTWPLVDAIWAGRLGEGNLAFLGYSQRILVALSSLITLGPSVVLVSMFGRMAQSQERLIVELTRIVRITVLLASPIALVVASLAYPVVRILFQRGAFDAHAADVVASLLPTMLTGMVAMQCTVVLFRGMIAARRLRPIAWSGAAWTVLYFCLSGLFSRYGGVSGISLAYLMSWLTIMAVTLSFLRLPGTPIGTSVAATSRFLISLVVVLGLTKAILSVTVPLLVDAHVMRPDCESLARLAVVAMVGFSAYYALSVYLVKAPEIVDLHKALIARLARA